MILDKLLEKKDLILYINLRVKFLQRKKKELNEIPEKKRARTIERFEGRIKELQQLKKVINMIKLKQMSKRYWREEASGTL